MNRKLILGQKGITLIALVVTIIVLIILAGVSTKIITEQNGILNKTKTAAVMENKEELLDNVKMDIASQVMENMGDKLTEEQLHNILDIYFENIPDYPGNKEDDNYYDWNNFPEGFPDSTEILIPREPYKNVKDVKIEDIYTEKFGDGTQIEDDTPLLPTKPNVSDIVGDGEKFQKNTEIEDDEGKTMWVPENFEVVEGDKIDEGVVIQDGVGNQFVWIPVENINNMVFCRTHNTYNSLRYDEESGELICEECKTAGILETKFAGKLFATTTGKSFNISQNSWTYKANSNLREPDIVSSYDGNSNNTNSLMESGYDNFAKQLEAEFYAMATSVAKYGGFYIGRYETGKLNTDTPVVQEGINEGIGNVTWYNAYKRSKNVVYDNKNTKNASVTSSMIWGCQWEQVMFWMKDIENTTITNSDGSHPAYITDSTGMANYSINSKMQSIKPTGQYGVNKIYDMAGNVSEWTLEAYSTNKRVVRGGNRSDKEHCSASYRWADAPTGSWDHYGSRVAIYIN